jgi:hypothetical protein
VVSVLYFGHEEPDNLFIHFLYTDGVEAFYKIEEEDEASGTQNPFTLKSTCGDIIMECIKNMPQRIKVLTFVCSKLEVFALFFGEDCCIKEFHYGEPQDTASEEIYDCFD